MSEPEVQGVISGGHSSADKGSRPAAELEGVLLTMAEQPPHPTFSLKSVILDPFWCLAATLKELFHQREKDPRTASGLILGRTLEIMCYVFSPDQFVSSLTQQWLLLSTVSI